MSGSKGEPLLPPPPSVEHNRAEQKHKALESKSARVSVAIEISAWIGFVFSLVALAVTAAVLFVSTTLSADKRAFFLGILGVCGVALQVVVCISRHEPIALLLFTQLSLAVSFLTLGLSITYA